jgi:hypothetical protein
MTGLDHARDIAYPDAIGRVTREGQDPVFIPEGTWITVTRNGVTERVFAKDDSPFKEEIIQLREREPKSYAANGFYGMDPLTWIINQQRSRRARAQWDDLIFGRRRPNYEGFVKPDPKPDPEATLRNMKTSFGFVGPKEAAATFRLLVDLNKRTEDGGEAREPRA